MKVRALFAAIAFAVWTSGAFAQALLLATPQTSLKPNDVPGLVQWLEGDIGVYTDAGCSTPATNGQSVYCVADQSGQGNNATQATSANRPTYATGAQNGHAALTFDGANAYMLSAYTGEPATIIVVHTVKGLTTGYTVSDFPLLGGDSSNGSGLGSYYFQATSHVSGGNPGQPGPVAYKRNDTAGATTNSPAAQPKINTWEILGVVGSGTGSFCTYRSTNSLGCVTQVGTPSNVTAAAIGAYYFPPGTIAANRFAGQIAEVIIYKRALSTTEYNAVVNGLNAKYNLGTSGYLYMAGMMVSGSATQDYGLYILQGSDGVHWNSRPTNLIPNTTNTASLQDPALFLATNPANKTGLNWIAASNYLSNTTNISHTIDLYSSPDLFTWTYVQSIDLSSYTGTGSGSKTTNPYWFVDFDSSIHLLLFAQNGSTNFGTVEVHPPSASNFSGTWSGPTFVTQPAGNYSPALVLSGGTYYLWYSQFVDGTHTYAAYATAPSLFGTYTPIKTGDWAGWFAQVGEIEEPAVVNVGGTWYTYVFGFGGGTWKTYYATSSTIGGTQSSLAEITTNFANSGKIQDAVVAQ